eukprot:evm.model.scf_650.4 EVM.evm.TU.scf_650.4   scf_650:36569-38823(+)
MRLLQEGNMVTEGSLPDQDGDPASDWGHLTFQVLECVKDVLERGNMGSTCLIKPARLVNRHWHRWATDAVTALTLSKEPFMARVVGKFTRLQCLTFARGFRGIGEHAVASLAIFDHLVDLDYRCLDVNDKVLPHLGALTALTRLRLCGYFAVTDEALLALRQLTGLKQLGLMNFYQITDNGLSHVGQLSGLKHLTISDAWGITGTGLAHLTKLSSMTWVHFSNCNVTDDGLRNVGKLTAIHHLALPGCTRFLDRGLEHLLSLRSLTHLDLTDCEHFTDDGLQHVAKLAALKRVVLIRCRQITEVGEAHMRGLAAECVWEAEDRSQRPLAAPMKRGWWWRRVKRSRRRR